VNVTILIGILNKMAVWSFGPCRHIRGTFCRSYVHVRFYAIFLMILMNCALVDCHWM